jgi:hypothetical protein
MSNKLVTQQQTRLAAGCYAAVFFFAILLWAGFSAGNSELQAEFDAKLQTLQNLRAKTNPVARDSSNGSPIQLFAEISAPSETIAASIVQKRLLEVAAGCGVTVHSIQAQVNSDSAPQQLRRIGSELTFDGPMDSLQKLLFEVENNVPFIFVDSMSVQPLPLDTKGLGEVVLRVTLTSSAYWQNHSTSGNEQ